MLTAKRFWLGTGIAYALGTLLVWGALWTTTDRWWLTSLVAYGPRWALLLPFPLLLLPALRDLRAKQPLLVVLLVSATVITALPIMGFHYAWRRPVPDHSPLPIRILTCNVDGEGARQAAFGRLIRELQPQIVALQECASFSAAGWPGEWHAERAGQLLIASPYPLLDVRALRRELPPSRWPPVNALRAVVQLPEGPVTVCCVHLRTPRYALDQLLSRKTLLAPRQAAAIRMETVYRQIEIQEILAWLEDVDGPLLVVGDLNTPPESWLIGKWRTGFSDAFAQVGRGYGYTKLTEHRGLRYGTRIDYIWCGKGLQAVRAWVDAEIGSDHLPLLADVQWTRHPTVAP
jgi:vancomycin resistance protein VanJ